MYKKKIIGRSGARWATDC